MSRRGVAEARPSGSTNSPMIHLLDVNVVLALVDPLHSHHARAHDWFAGQGQYGWASCAITQNGAMRILGQSRYTNPVDSIAEAADIIGELCRHPAHHFLTAELSLLDSSCIDRTRLLSPGQITDTYLLALAVTHGARLASFDTRLVTDAVRGGRDALHLIG